MKRNVLDNIKWRESLVFLITLLFISYNSIAQCPCAAAQTTEAASGSTTTISSIRIDNGDNLCIKGTGGGTATVQGYVNMFGGELYFCTEDDTKITFGSAMDVTSEWNTGGGTVYTSAEVTITDDYDVYGFNWENSGVMTAQDINISRNTSTNTTAQFQNTGTLTSSGNIQTASTNSSFINDGTATIVSTGSNGGTTSQLINNGSLTVTGNATRSQGSTENHGVMYVTGTLTLSGDVTGVDLTGGYFEVGDLDITNGAFEASAGDCAVFYVKNSVKIINTVGRTGNVYILDETPNGTGDALNGNSNYTIANGFYADALGSNVGVDCYTILPVRFLDVYLEGNQLHWITTQEENNEYFVVERSFDGKTFEKVGNVKGAINSNYNIQYVFEDTDKIYKQAYYRIKQVDIDGKFTYSKIVTSINDNEPIITLYPNPTSQSDLNMSIENVEGNVSYQIISSIGDVLISNDVEVKDHFFEETIDVSNYTSGIYFVKVQTAQKIIVEQLIIE